MDHPAHTPPPPPQAPAPSAAGPRTHVLEEGYRGFLIRIPIPEQDGRIVPQPVQASVTAVTEHAAAHLDAVRWDAVEQSEGDLHTLVHIKHAIDVALDGAEHQPPLPGVFEPGSD